MPAEFVWPRAANANGERDLAMWSSWQIGTLGLGIILGAVSLLWLLSVRLRDASIADPFWGLGFIILAWLAYDLCRPAATPRSLLMCGLVTIWGLRLLLYLLWRNWGHAEDARYASMRRYQGSQFWWTSLFTVFLLQGMILWVVALPVLMTATVSTGELGSIWDLFGTVLWCVGVSFETIGDWQLARFKANPANEGQVLRKGLWRYTRHPNYFGEFCVWWGIYLIAVAGGAWWTIISPLMMSLLLMRISGVTLLESTIAERRPDYADYRRTTNAFFPGIPRSAVRNPVP